uniref:Protein transport protein Sec24B n=2 Tax=Schistocephalus solidus TaxID=70667 RepID=A0A0X3PGR2_SCHSO
MAESLRRDLIRYLTRRIGFEAVLRIRCTRGLNIQNFYGCFFVRSVDLLSLPNVNPDAGYAMQLEMTESLEEFKYVVLQAALLYTSAFGDRRIRVHTLCLPVTESPEAVFNYSDQTAIACLITKMAVERTISAGLSNSREALSTVISDILMAYQRSRNKQASNQVHLCPSSLRLLPAYVCGALRFLAFRLHIPTSLDDRSAALELLINASCSRLMSLIYPRLYDVRRFIQRTPTAVGNPPDHRTLAEKAAGLSLRNDSVDPEPDDPERLPGRLNLNSNFIKRDGVFLLDTGFFLILLVGYDIPAEELRSLIGYDSVDEIHVDSSALRLPPLPSDDQVASLPKPRRRLQQLIGHLRRDHLLGTALILVRHDAPEFLKHQFINALVEDRTESAPSYMEFIQMVLNFAR